MGELHVNLRPVERAITRVEHPLLGGGHFLLAKFKKNGNIFFSIHFQLYMEKLHESSACIRRCLRGLAPNPDGDNLFID